VKFRLFSSQVTREWCTNSRAESQRSSKYKPCAV